MPQEELPPNFETLVTEFTEKILAMERLERNVARLGWLLCATLFLTITHIVIGLF
jgi:hypothetical protein